MDDSNYSIILPATPFLLKDLAGKIAKFKKIPFS
jgi:hypothetical protein